MDSGFHKRNASDTQTAYEARTTKLERKNIKYE
jgi:hypothetical protein